MRILNQTVTLGLTSASCDRKLAIVITCFNYEAYVGLAIESARTQLGNDCELVVIDDGSTDGSWEVISRSGVTAYRIKNGGQREACLFGLDQTKAPFVLFLDADDELKPGAVDVILAKLDPDVAKLQFSLTRIAGSGEGIDGGGSNLASFRARDVLIRRVCRTGVYQTPPTSGNVFRRDVCDVLRQATYDTAVDGAVLFAAPFFGDVVSLSQELGRYRIHDRNDSGVGRSINPATLERDINRFVERMTHLRTFVAGRSPRHNVADPLTTYFFLERSFCLAIARGQRPAPARLPHLVWRLLEEPYPVHIKGIMAVFFLAGTVLPNRWAATLVARRFSVGHRFPMRRGKEASLKPASLKTRG